MSSYIPGGSHDPQSDLHAQSTPPAGAIPTGPARPGPPPGGPYAGSPAPGGQIPQTAPFHAVPGGPTPPAGTIPTGPTHPGPPPGGPFPYRTPPAKRSWFARHKVLTGVGAVVALVIVGSALGGGGSDTKPTPASNAVASRSSVVTADQDGSAPGTASPDAAAPAEPTAQAQEETASGVTFPGMKRSDLVAMAGEMIDDDGVQVTATPLAAGDSTFGPTACSTVTIVNNGSGSLDVNALDFSLQDPNGVIVSVGLFGTDNHISAATLIAGGTLSGDVCFDSNLSSGGQYVLLYEPVYTLFSNRMAWVNEF